MKALSSSIFNLKNLCNLKRQLWTTAVKPDLTESRFKSQLKTLALKVSKEQLLDVARTAANAGASVSIFCINVKFNK